LQASSSSHHDAVTGVVSVSTAAMWMDYSFVWRKLILQHDFDVQLRLLLPDVVIVVGLWIEALLMTKM